jgi:hypothetical protein
MPVEKQRVVCAISLFAGGMDTTTGLLLITAPVYTLATFGASLPEGGETLMRFIGTFVAGIGMSYLWGIAPKSKRDRMHRLFGVWGATAIARTGIALFTISAVAAGSLEPQWLVVGFTDGILAITQTVLLRKGWLNGESAT